MCGRCACVCMRVVLTVYWETVPVYVVRVCMYACSTYGVLGDSVSVYVVRVCMYACST